MTVVEKAILENLKYDKKSGKLFWKNSRQKVSKGKEAGSKNNKGYITVGIARKRMMLHRVIWFLYYKKWPVNQIDHIDGDPSNNRIKNLRDVTNRENQQNRKCHRDGRLVGVYFIEGNKKNPYVAKITINNKHTYLGFFPTEKKAHLRYKKALKELVNI